MSTAWSHVVWESTVVGVLVGTAFLVARTAIGDVLTIAIFVLASLTVVFAKKNPEQLVVLGAAVGLAAYPLLRPDWMLK